MAPILGMETFAARLASFEKIVPAPKRRGSNTKGQKSISWPHKNPSSEELAEAGLYYNPSASSPDNTTCFLCESQLAGWEEDDVPAREHLKLSSHCGWAIIKNSGHEAEDVDTMEDPTEERFYEARKSTFGSRWPHEQKRGWLCKTEKMAAAGWHFAPTPEFDDFVSCAYCNLSLDGWEPKDSPFDEHYRRSPGCAFFVFAGTAAPKVGRGKKARTSKASRLSTQSNGTVTSQAQSIPDLNDSIDVSNISQDTVFSTASTMASQKGVKGKGKSTRVKNAKPIEIVEASGQTVAEQQDVSRRGTKRKSEEISEDHRAERESTVKPEPQPKRRATRSRKSETQQIDYPVLNGLEPAHEKPVRGGQKRASSKSRKISTASAATIASLRVAIPDDAEIEAALEADLDKPMADQPHVEAEAVGELPKSKPRGRGKKTNASTAPARSTRQATAELEASQDQAVTVVEPVPASNVEEEDKAISKSKARKGRVTKKPANKNTARSGRASDDATTTLATNAESQLNSSILTAQTIADDSGHETDASVASQKSVTRKGSKRKVSAKTKEKKAGLMSKNIEDIVQTTSASQSAAEAVPVVADDGSLIVVEEILTNDHGAGENIEAEQPKRVTRGTRGGKTKANTTKKAKAKLPQLSMPGMFSPLLADIDPSFNSVLATSSPPVAPVTRSGLGADQRIPATLVGASSPALLNPAKDDAFTPDIARSSPAGKQTSTPRRRKNTNEATPSPSPQSSDAENQPPSSRPTSLRPPLATLSPTNGSMHRIPLAPGTPRQVPLSPSKIGGLKSQMPWTAVDVEMIFAACPDKENRNILAALQKTGLTSPERAMSVEDWIKSQASRAEENLKAEAERVVSTFEREGGRALGVLEGIDVLE